MVLWLGMDSGLLRAIHFARAWARPETRLGEDEVEVETTHGTLDATRYRRRGAPPGPAWILLHGMTRTGRRHTTLMRFARSIAESGATVLVPEVPEWVELTRPAANPAASRPINNQVIRFMAVPPASSWPVGAMGTVRADPAKWAAPNDTSRAFKFQ